MEKDREQAQISATLRRDLTDGVSRPGDLLASESRLKRPFEDLTTELIPSVIKFLEFRTVFKLESERLAASRRSPEFLQLICSGITLYNELKGRVPGARTKDYNMHLDARPLRGGLVRYKLLLRSLTVATEEVHNA